jgi:hypothetical protein
MKKFIERDGSYFVRAEDVVIGMKLDFEGDSIADPNGNGTTDLGHYEAFEFEFAVVNEITREGPTCIVLHTSQGDYGFPPDHEIETTLDQPSIAARIVYNVHDYGYDVNVLNADEQPIETYSAGNHALESQGRVEKGDPHRVPKHTLRRFAKQTAGEFASERGLQPDAISEEEV